MAKTWRRVGSITQKSRDKNWLQLLDSGLAGVRNLLKCRDGGCQFQTLMVLEEIGLLKLLKEAWMWQDSEVCEGFVVHWDHNTRKTAVHGVEIDSSYMSFVAATGLKNERKVLSLEQASKASRAQKYAAIFGVEAERWNTALISDCKDPLVQNLLALLNKTVWFAHKQPHLAQRDLIYLLVEALDGNKFSWGKCVYEKFVAEVRRLQSLHAQGSSYQIPTLAGPLMYFLYTHAKRRTHVCKRIIAQSNTKEVVNEVLSCLPGKSIHTRRVCSVEDRCDGLPCVKIPKRSNLLSPSSTKVKRRRLEDVRRCKELPCQSLTPPDPITKLQELEDEIARKREEISLLQLAEAESRLKAEKLEKLYIEEQKHAHERLKLQFEALNAEGEIADLRWRVAALNEQLRESAKGESLLEMQLDEMRRRWETATLRAELAEIQAAEKSCLLLRLLPSPAR